jgi:hypothetical protein
MSKANKKILIILSLTYVFSVTLFSLGIAYYKGIKGMGYLGVWFFLTFGIIVVLAQLIPACLLIVSVIRVFYSHSGKHELPAQAV